MNTKYTFNKIVSPDTLEFEIRRSNIAVALDSIQSTSNSVDVWFKATLDSNSESILNSIINSHVAIPLLYQGNPKDQDNALIIRPKAARAGWAYQLHSLSFHTAKMDSFFSKKLNPISRLLTDIGFSTIKFYDENNTELTEPNQLSEAVWTVVDWCATHEIEVIGGTLFQECAPSERVYLWMHLAPGILNFPFLEGGINLEMIGAGNNLRADGRVSKYLHPAQPVPGINKFRFTANHPKGFVHEIQFCFEFFKPVS